MVEKLTFQKLYLYDLAEPGITVPVLLMSGERQTEFKAKLDTGASGCIFSRIYGEELGLDIEKGTPQRRSPYRPEQRAYLQHLQMQCVTGARWGR